MIRFLAVSAGFVGAMQNLNEKLPKLVERVIGRSLVKVDGREISRAWLKSIKSLEALMTQLRDSAISAHGRFQEEIPKLYATSGCLSEEAKALLHKNRALNLMNREKSMGIFREAFETHLSLSSTSGLPELGIFEVGRPIVALEVEDELIFQAMINRGIKQHISKFMGSFLRVDLSLLCNAGVAFTQLQKKNSEKFYSSLNWSFDRKLKSAKAALAHAQKTASLADEAFRREIESRRAYTDSQALDFRVPLSTEILLSNSLLDMLVRASLEKPMLTASYELVGILDALTRGTVMTRKQRLLWKNVQRAIKELTEAEAAEGFFVGENKKKLEGEGGALAMSENCAEQIRLASAVFSARRRLLREMRVFLSAV